VFQPRNWGAKAQGAAVWTGLGGGPKMARLLTEDVAMRLVMALVLGLALGLPILPVMAQEQVAQFACAGGYTGVQMQGVLLIERWYTMRAYRYYGQFQDTMGNFHEFEVFSPTETGTGSTWTNGARHRETFINFQLGQGSFAIQTEDGITAQFQCQ
jgi:hypothetical protein